MIKITSKNRYASLFKHSSHGIAYRTIVRFESCPIKYFMIADDVHKELFYSVNYQRLVSRSIGIASLLFLVMYCTCTPLNIKRMIIT